MSEILIKGMEMPKYCCHCRFESSSIHGQYCILTKKFTRLDDNEDGSERHISCPLVEVPPHGRLGDLDKVANRFHNYSKACMKNGELEKAEMWQSAEQEVRLQGTILEASEER